MVEDSCNCLYVTGVQRTEVVCMKITGVQVVVTDENCDPSLRPTGRTVTCNNTPCPPAYVNISINRSLSCCLFSGLTRVWVLYNDKISLSDALLVSSHLWQINIVVILLSGRRPCWSAGGTWRSGATVRRAVTVVSRAARSSANSASQPCLAYLSPPTVVSTSHDHPQSASVTSTDRVSDGP